MTSASVRRVAGAFAADAAGLAAEPLTGAGFAETDFAAVGLAAREVGGLTDFAPARRSAFFTRFVGMGEAYAFGSAIYEASTA